ncbi:lipocalin family protein [Capnocytophaga sputigena]|uniref:lipocalin family protein n=1 Tax=Capnocytophaga sputigena TaxID=1019 RepID=UPI0028D78C8C|nr:lipocalin family protein [Capnocytophaga sputigena]
MKKIIFSALVATTLCLSSCGKDDDNSGGSTSLNGDWYQYAIYNNLDGYGFRWITPHNCAQKTYWSISDKKIKHEWYYSEGSECKYTPVYYDYTATNGVFNITVANDSPNGNKGGTASIKYEIKDKELILRFKNNQQQEEIQVLHKKGVDYSYLDPLVGLWELTKIEAGGTTYPAGTPACFTGYIIASSIGFSLYYTLPANSTQCQAGKVESYDYVKEGGKYYNVSNGQKVPLPFSFSNNNRTLTLSLGGTTMFFQKQ